MNGKALQLGSKVRVLDREHNSLGVSQLGFLGLITRVDSDKKGPFITVEGIGRARTRQGQARPNMVERRTYKSGLRQ